MFQSFKIFIAILLTLSFAFALFQRAALANFVQNAWQGYKLTTGLIAYWSFDGKDIDLSLVGAEVRDRSGNGYNGNWVNHATTTTIGKIGQAITFDGVDDYVDYTSQINGIQTIAFWMNGTSTPSTKIIDVNGTANIESINGTITANNFTAPTIYVDGVVASTVTAGWHHVVITTGTSINTVATTLGKVSSGFFPGSLDEVRLYNRALSADEAKRLYLMGASLKTNVSHRDELTEGLAGYWTFDGKDIDLAQMTGEVLDSSIQGTSGDWRNHATTTTVGKIGQAITFDGVDDFVNISFGGDAIETVSFWMNGTSTPSAKIIDFTGTANIESINGTITANNFTGSTIYVDGVVASTVTAGWHHVLVTTSTGVDGGTITLGKIASGFFTGALDEIRIYDRVLSADEAKRLYLMGASLKTNVSHRDELTEGLVGYWTFNGANIDLSSSTKEVLDVSGNENHGNWKSHATTTTIGKIGQAIDFDGVDDYIEIPDAASLRPGNGSWSISLWMNAANTAVTRSFTGKRNTVSFSNYGMGISNGDCHTPSAAKKIIVFMLEAASVTERCRYTNRDVVDGQWHHIVGVADKNADMIYIYVDGVQEATTASFTNGSWPTLSNTDFLGLARANGSSSYYTDALDEVRFYMRALSPDEAKRLYLMGK